jgi:hypothetical protein
VQHHRVDDAGQRLDGVVVGVASRPADCECPVAITVFGRGSAPSGSSAAGARTAWTAWLKMSYDSESSLIVPPAVTSSQDQKIGVPIRNLQSA